MSPHGKSLALCFGALIALMVIGVSLAQGQTTDLEARVTYVAGDNVYIAIGRNAGVIPGDTLNFLLSSGRPQWALVRSAMRDRSVLELPGATSLVRSGDMLRITDEHEIQNDVPQGAPLVVIPPTYLEDSPPPEASKSSSRNVAPRRSPRLNGRILAGVGGLRSSTATTSGSTSRVSRSFVTPWTSLQLEGRNLPYDLTFRTRLRVDYRYSSGRPASPELLFRAYEAVVERSFAAGRLQAGRFSNRYAVTGGYWDGVLMEYGPGDTGVGASFGFLPTRSNGSFSSETPKIALFAHNRHRIGNLRQALYGWYQEIFLPGLQPTRRNFGLSYRARLRGINSNNRLELDRNPESGAWVVTRGSFQMSGLATRWLSLRGRYELRQPYSMYRPFAVISYRRDQVTAGATIQSRSSSVGADIVLNYTYRSGEVREKDGTSFRIYAGTSPSRALRLNATASYWTSENGNSSLVNLGASRSFDRLYSRLNYQYSRSTRFDTNIASHVISVGLSAPITKRLRSTADLRFQGGSNLSSFAFNLNFTLAL